MNLSTKALNIESSLTLALTAKAGVLRSKGIDVISFGVGEPDFNTPKNIIDAAINAMNSGKTKYTATSGIAELKRAIIKKLKKDNNLNYNMENIIISTGAKQCLANVFAAILNDNDEVLVPMPYWVSYPELIKLNDGIPVFIEASKDNSFKVTPNDLERYVTKKTKALIINSPSNPTGVIYNEKELRDIAEFCKKHNLLIISDEIYEKLSYDNNKHISIASLNDDTFQRTVVINGFSKSYSMTGWRIGYAVGNKEIIKLMNSIQSHVTSNANTISQYAALEALEGQQDELNLMVKEFESRRNLMVNLLKNIPKITFIKPEGAFYVMVDIGEILEINNINGSLKFAELLLSKENVVVIPGVAFGKNNYIRLSYATSIENIENGLNRIKRFIKNLNS